MMSEQELERFWQPEPIYAWKRYSHRDDNKFRGLYGPPLELGVETRYKCHWLDGYGPTTGRKCVGEWPLVQHLIVLNSPCGTFNIRRDDYPTCGFYAYKLTNRNVSDSTSLLSTAPNIAMCLVELSGIVVEYEYGYRAEKQTILDWKNLPEGHDYWYWENTVHTYRLMWKDMVFGDKLEGEKTWHT